MVAPCRKQVLTILEANPTNTLVITEKLYDLARNKVGAPPPKNEKLTYKRHSVECYNCDVDEILWASEIKW